MKENIHFFDQKYIYMKYRIVIFEAEGGTDKGLDGHRKDTLPIANALRVRGWDVDILKFRDEWAQKIYDHCKDRYDAYITRVNPGTIPSGEKIFFQTLRKLSEKGLIGFSHPDVMQTLGAKDALVKLVGTGLVPDDTFAYYTPEELEKNFPVSISFGERVIKQNRGSTGEGIWRVQVIDERPYEKGTALPLDTRLKLTEAKDNHTEYKTLGEFIEFAKKYTEGEDGMVVDMKFLPRIKEGEIRILMVGEKPIFVVHKKPAEAEDAFSATLFSGAKYTYQKPEEWSVLVDSFLDKLPEIMKRLGNFDAPLIWTADFILDTDEAGKDKYVLGEINNSCVGFTSHLSEGIQDKVADRVIEIVTRKFTKKTL